MLNHVVLMGRITKEIDLRHTQSGTAVAGFTIAVDRDFAPKDGGEKETDFVDIVAWRNTAEFVSKYFGKGRMAVVSGRLQMRKWQDKEGNNRVSAEIVADNVYFGDSKRDDADNRARKSEPYVETPKASAPHSDYGEIELDDSNDLPF